MINIKLTTLKNAFQGISIALLAGLIVSVVTVPTNGHGIFKKALEKKYKPQGLKVTCNMCHVKGEKKTERNEVGQVFFAQFKGQELSAKWDAAEGADRKKLEVDVMTPAFLTALDEIYEQEKKGKLKSSLHSQIPAGEVAGSKLRKK